VLPRLPFRYWSVKYVIFRLFHFPHVSPQNPYPKNVALNLSQSLIILTRIEGITMSESLSIGECLGPRGVRESWFGDMVQREYISSVTFHGMAAPTLPLIAAVVNAHIQDLLKIF